MPVRDEVERRGGEGKGGRDEREKGGEREWIRLIEGKGKDKHPKGEEVGGEKRTREREDAEAI
jgi:hypothetical protein